MTRHIEVGTAKYRKAKAPTVLETSGQGPCLAICVYDSQSKQGYLGHIPGPRDCILWYELIDKIVKECKDVSDLEVTLTGLSFETTNKNQIRDGLQERKFVVDYLVNKGFNPKKIKRLFSQEDIGIVTKFDLTAGTVIVEEF